MYVIFRVTDGWLQQHCVLPLASLTQLYFCSEVTLAYKLFFTGSQIACLIPSLAVVIDFEPLDRYLEDCAVYHQIVAVAIE